MEVTPGLRELGGGSNEPAHRRLVEQASDAGISSEVPNLVAKILRRAEAVGYGRERVAAMVKVLRRAT
jgi:hypothetical protein